MSKSTFPLKLLFTVLLVGNAALTSLDKDDLRALKCALHVSSAEFFGTMGVLILLLTAFALVTSLAIQRQDQEFDPLITAVASMYLNYRAIGILANGFNEPSSRNLVIAMIIITIIALAVGAYGNRRFKDQYYVFALGQCYLLLFFATAMIFVTLSVNRMGAALNLEKSQFILNPGVATGIVALPYLITSMFGYAYKLPRPYAATIYGLFMVPIAVFVPYTIDPAATVIPDWLKVITPCAYALAFFGGLEWLRTKKITGYFGKKYWVGFTVVMTGIGLLAGSLFYVFTPSEITNRVMLMAVHALGAFMTALLIAGFEYYFHCKILPRLPITIDQE